MSQVGVFLGKLGGIVVGREFLQQAGLPEENGFYLKKIIAVLVDGLQGNGLCPLFEGVAVGAETEVAGQGEKKGLFPVAFALD